MRQHRPSRRNRLLLPRLELLEDRCVPATIVVNSNADTAAPAPPTVTLRSAILQAEKDPTPDTITFAANLNGQTITLSSALPILTKGETITGLGPTNLTVLAAPNPGASLFFNVFTDNSFTNTVTISGLTITGGHVSGADGGGIFNTGFLALTNDVITGNEADAALNSDGGVNGGHGGGVASAADLGGDPLTITNTVVSSNIAVEGGGLYDLDAAAIAGTTITSNTANTVNVSGTVEFGDGGGFWNGGISTLATSTVSGNTANAAGDSGGGILNAGGLTVTGSTLSGNQAVGSGGGAAVTTGGTLTLLNSTVANNTTTQGVGGGISSDFANLTINDSTVTGNADNSTSGGVGGVNGGAFSTTFDLNNTIIAGNSTPAGDPDAKGIVNSGQGNFIGIAGPNLTGISNGTGGNQIGTAVTPLNPLLGPLQNNGGTTLTVSPLAGSLVIDKGVTAVIPAGTTTDQRGFLRIVGVAVDVGAVEFQPAANVSLSANPGSVTFGQSTTLTATVNPPAPGPNNPIAGFVTFFNGATPIGNGALNAGAATITFTANSAGTFVLSATYNALPYPNSPAAPIPFVINPAPTSTTLTVSPNPVVFGQSATLTAMVTSSPGLRTPGTVTFFSGSTPLGTAAVNPATGVAALIFTAPMTGALALSATYMPANGNLVSSASGTIAVTSQSPQQAIGVFNPFNETWFLKNSDGPGAADITPFAYGGFSWDGLTGDWNGTGSDSVAVMDPATATWYIKFTNTAGAPDIPPFQFGEPFWVPLDGNWTGTGQDTIAVVDPTTMTWYIKFSNGPGAPDITPFQFGPPGSIPVVGDWTGTGHDGIGAFDPNTGIWYLRNEVGPGAPDAGQFQFGPAFGPTGSTPVVGDWGGNGKSTVAVFDQDSATWYIKFSNSAGAPDVTPFQYGGAMYQSFAGAWQNPGPVPLSADAAGSGTAALDNATLQTVVSAALSRLTAAGVDANLIRRLEAVQYDVGTLPGNTLGLTFLDADRIEISATAAGRGWFTDASAASDAQYVNGTALPGTPAAQGMDLLTTVLHEMSHIAGRPDVPPGAGDGLTIDVLGVGQRRVQALDQVFAAGL